MIIPTHAAYALMQPNEKALLAEISSTIQDDGVILEIGSWLLGSTSIIAANTNARIYAFDLYDSVSADKIDDSIPMDMGDIDWYRQAEAHVIGTNTKRSAENMQDFISDEYPTIKCITNTQTTKCYNDITRMLVDGIDMYFEDGDHTNPILKKHLDLFVPLIKKGGYFVAHDYKAPYAEYSDLDEIVDEMIADTKTWELKLEVDHIVVLSKLV